LSGWATHPEQCRATVAAIQVGKHAAVVSFAFPVSDLVDAQSAYLGVLGGEIKLGLDLVVVEPLDGFGTHIEQGGYLRKGGPPLRLSGAAVRNPFSLPMGIAFGGVG